MNPFIYGTVATGENFYDREDELKRIISTLRGGNNLVMFAPRRYGKTSLVFKCIAELEKLNYRCIYFDFMPVFSKDYFVTSYSKAVIAAQPALQRNLKRASKFLKGLSPKLSFDPQGNPELSIEIRQTDVHDELLSEALDLPENLNDGGKKTFIFIDEFQEIAKLNGDNFEKLFRSKIQLHKKVNYMFLGSRTSLLSDMFNNKGRAFYNSAMVMQIGKLPLKESVMFLANQFEKSGMGISQEASEFLINQAGDIPYYIQMLAAEVWQRVVKERKIIDEPVIRLSVDSIIELKSDYYFELWDKLPAYQKRTLLAINKSGENIYSMDYTRRYGLKAISSVQKAAAAMINEGIIEKKEEKYSLADPFFSRYLTRFYE